jgi:hypothetical protein
MNTSAFTESVRAVGDWIRSERREFNANHVEAKALNSLVSYVDQQAEQMLVERLTALLPGSGVLGEEGGESWVDGGANWIIDPLDGTTNFIHDLPPYAVSVALMHDRDLVWAAVYELGQARMFTAAKGHGAWCDGRLMDVRQGAPLRDGLVATGFPYHEFSQMPQYLEALQPPPTSPGSPTGAFKAFLSTDSPLGMSPPESFWCASRAGGPLTFSAQNWTTTTSFAAEVLQQATPTPTPTSFNSPLTHLANHDAARNPDPRPHPHATPRVRRRPWLLF